MSRREVVPVARSRARNNSALLLRMLTLARLPQKALILILGLLLSFSRLARADSAPPFLWAGSMGGNSNAQAYAVAVDPSGNVLVTGFFMGTNLIGTTNLVSSGAEDIFVAKYNAAGTFLWARRAGGIGYDEGRGIAADPAGNIYVTGLFQNTASFGSATLTSSGQSDVFIAKYDPNGNLLWARAAGGTDFDEAHAIAVDGQGNAYITGYFDATATFGTFSLPNRTGSDNIFVAKCSGSGTFLWAEQVIGSLNDVGNGIALDGATNVYVTGYFSGSATFGTNTLTSAGTNNSPDVFLAKYDLAGNLLWVRQAGGSGDDEGMAAAADATGNVWITGKFFTSAAFGSTNVSGPGTQIFVARYDSAGNLVWVTRAGGANLIYGNAGFGIATDNATNALVAGYFSGTATFGTSNLVSAGFDDIFCAKYDSVGNLLWARSAGGPDLDLGYGVAADPWGDVFVTGFYASSSIAFDSNILTNTGARDGFVAKLGQIIVPSLTIATTNSSVTLTWPAAAAGFVLESSGQLPATNWTPITPVNNAGTSSIVTVPMSASQGFFRLHKQ